MAQHLLLSAAARSLNLVKVTERAGADDATVADRFAYRRLVPDALALTRLQVSRERTLITALVFGAIGAASDDGDAVHRFGLTGSRRGRPLCPVLGAVPCGPRCGPFGSHSG